MTTAISTPIISTMIGDRTFIKRFAILPHNFVIAGL